MSNEEIICDICHHHCKLLPGRTGRCKIRENVNGENRARNYGVVTSLALDPIEKKPLAYFYPETKILSVGSYGCNLTCPFCQNYSISMSNGNDIQTITTTPEILVNEALKYVPQGNIGIAFTYNEPLISYEFVRDTAKLAHEKGLKTVVVSNGDISPAYFAEVAPLIDAFNIDLKGLSIYDSISGNLENVLKNIKTAADLGKHVEVTTLVIPGLNDSEEEIREISRLLKEISPEIVLHITRFFPQYKLNNIPPTPVKDIINLSNVARENLERVETGNI